MNFEKLPDQKLSVEIEEHTPNEVAEILATSYAKNKDVLSEKIDTHIEKANKQLEEIKHRIVETNLERYGCEYTQQNKGVRDKTINTCINILGIK
mgnify:CR=1 FL=1